MSRRRAARAQDSLELLLDTICNTFGGVLFIAILVILLLQQTSPNSAPPVETEITPAELQMLAIRWESVAGELSRLRENRRSQQTVVDSVAPADLRAQLEERRELTAQQDELQTELDTLLARRADLTIEIEEQTSENEVVRRKAVEADERRDREQSLLDDDRQARMQEIRLPVVRSRPGKQEIGLIMRYGRLYVWHKYGPGYRRHGLNTDDFVVISTDDDELKVRPKPTRGTLVDASPESQAAVTEVLKRFDPRSCYLAVIVRPDSYGEFRHVRDAAIQLGLEYRLIAVGDKDPVADRGGSGGKVQ
jgi:hypothetical protein